MPEYKPLPEDPKPWEQDLEDNISVISDEDDQEEYEVQTDSDVSEVEIEQPPIKKFNVKKGRTQYTEILQEELNFFPEDIIINGFHKRKRED